MKNSQRFMIIAALAALLTAPRASAAIYWSQPATASWTSSSALDSATSLSVLGFSTFSVSLQATSTMTAGTLNFEASNDGGTNWYPISLVRPDATAIESTFPLSVTTKLWQGNVGALTNVRVRLNPQITGSGTATVRVLASEAATIAGSSELVSGYSWTDGSAPTPTTAGNITRLLTSTDGRLATTTDHPKRFTCSVVNSAATTLTAFGGQCVTPGAGFSLYITDINASASVAATTTADQYTELKYGTGGTCGTGTTVIWAGYNAANTPNIAQFITPLKVPANNELCWMHAAAGSKTFIVSGYIAP